MTLSNIVKPYVVALLTVSFLSGCFVVRQQDRNQVASSLGPSSWPIPSGIYSRTHIESGKTTNDYGTIRRKVVRGQRIYVIDGKPNEFYAFYPQQGDTYIVEHYSPKDDWVSAFTYVIVDPANGAIGSFDNDCSDLSGTQRNSLFGNSEASTCVVRTAHGSLSDLGFGGVVDMLNLSMRAKGEIKSVYRLQRQVTDALQ